MFIKLLRTNFIGRQKYFTALIDFLAADDSKKLARRLISDYLMLKITFISLINITSLKALYSLYLIKTCKLSLTYRYTRMSMPQINYGYSSYLTLLSVFFYFVDIYLHARLRNHF